ncbi:MAG: response regulator transcription factor [Oscillospiraceae bacterium]|nr:response regulator transcription factor [Oscillospiraceae bacterium]MBR6609217.1 response regulator transcription factor [Oscillospiraceae bacterium]
MKIWCIEDDININNLVVYALESSGYDVQGFVNFYEFDIAMKNEKPDLIILDVMLPDKDGMEILQGLREKPSTSDIPVIMLTAKTAESDKVRALDMGADDYVPKPFGVMELISRVRAVLRRVAPKNTEELIVCHNVSVSPSRHRVDVDGVTIELTLKEYNLLYLLVSNQGQVFSRKQLMDKVWGDSYVGESRTIDMHIKTLRQKLEAGGDIIKTVRGVGYKAE